MSADILKQLNKYKSDHDKGVHLQELMKNANAIIKSKKNVLERLVELGLTEAQAQKLQTPDFAGRIGFPAYQLTNNNANNKRIQGRIDDLTKKLKGAKAVAKTGQAEEYVFYGGTIEVNYGIDRVQILFPGGRVEKELFRKLRSNGYVYSPTNQAFQRKITPQAIRNAIGLFNAKKVEQSDIEKGIEVETEHLNTLEKVASGEISVEQAPEEIAKDHLIEDTKYYDKLEQVEGKTNDVASRLEHYKNLLKNIDKYPKHNKNNVKKIIAELESQLAEDTKYYDKLEVVEDKKPLEIENTSEKVKVPLLKPFTIDHATEIQILTNGSSPDGTLNQLGKVAEFIRDFNLETDTIIKARYTEYTPYVKNMVPRVIGINLGNIPLFKDMEEKVSKFWKKHGDEQKAKGNPQFYFDKFTDQEFGLTKEESFLRTYGNSSSDVIAHTISGIKKLEEAIKKGVLKDKDIIEWASRTINTFKEAFLPIAEKWEQIKGKIGIKKELTEEEKKQREVQKVKDEIYNSMPPINSVELRQWVENIKESVKPLEIEVYNSEVARYIKLAQDFVSEKKVNKQRLEQSIRFYGEILSGKSVSEQIIPVPTNRYSEKYNYFITEISLKEGWQQTIEREVKEAVEMLKWKLIRSIILNFTRVSSPIKNIEKLHLKVGRMGFEGEYRINFKTGAYFDFKTQGIGAGGYNIQVYHHRYISNFNNITNPDGTKGDWNTVAQMKWDGVETTLKPTVTNANVINTHFVMTNQDVFHVKKGTIGKIISKPNPFVTEVFFGKDSTGNFITQKIDNGYLTKLTEIPTLVKNARGTESFEFVKTDEPKKSYNRISANSGLIGAISDAKTLSRSAKYGFDKIFIIQFNGEDIFEIINESQLNELYANPDLAKGFKVIDGYERGNLIGKVIKAEVLEPNTPDEFDEAIFEHLDSIKSAMWIGNLMKQRIIAKEIYSELHGPDTEKHKEVQRLFKLYYEKEKADPNYEGTTELTYDTVYPWITAENPEKTPVRQATIRDQKRKGKDYLIEKTTQQLDQVKKDLENAEKLMQNPHYTGVGIPEKIEQLKKQIELIENPQAETQKATEMKITTEQTPGKITDQFDNFYEDVTFHEDAGHGWLAVPKNWLFLLGIADEITGYSYERGETVYLEEDADLTTFIKAIDKYILWSPNLFKNVYNDTSPIRNYASYVPPKKDIKITSDNDGYKAELNRQLEAGEIKDDSEGISLTHLARHIQTKPKVRPTPTTDPGTLSEIIERKYDNQYTLNKGIEAFITKIGFGISPSLWTTEQKTFIKKYSGYGGLNKFGVNGPGAFFEFYTPVPVIRKMWALAYKYGYKGGSILESSVGIGEFLAFAPTDSNITAYEVNEFSAEICRVLYPNAKVVTQPFEKVFIKNNFTVKDKVDGIYDLCIGNPPYGSFENVASRYLSGMGELKHVEAKNYAEYFMRRSLDLLKPGGLLVLIVGASVVNGGTLFLDSDTSPVKEYLAEHSDLLDAYRLPDAVFERTDVTSEIIVLQKK